MAYYSAMENRPDWVVIGIRKPTSVWLIASKTLDEAELRTETDAYDDPFARFGYVIPLPRRTTLTVVMPEFVLIEADDYNEAWQRLFAQWSPPEQPAIGNGSVVPRR